MIPFVRDLSTLLRLRLRLLSRITVTRYTQTSRSAAPIRLLLFGVVGVWLLLTAVAPLSTTLGTAFSGPNARTLLARSLSWGLSVAMLVAVFYGMVSLISVLTYRSDLRLLLLTPAAPWLVMGSKLLSVSLGLSAPLLLGVPGVLAAGQALDLGPPYTVAVLLMVLYLPIGPVSLALLLILPILRWLPPAAARTASSVMAILLGAGFFIASQLVFGPAGRPGGVSIPSPSLPVWLPPTWPGRGLAAIGLGQPGTAIAYLLPSILLTAALFIVATTLSARLFATGAATYQEVRRRAVSHGQRAMGTRPRIQTPQFSAQYAMPTAHGPLPNALRPLLRKEWLTLRRDPQRLVTVLYPLVIVGFYLYRIVSVHPSAGDERLSGFLVGSLYAVLAFTGVLLVGPIASTIVNREGRSLYLLGLAPLRPRDLLAIKWLFCCIPVLVVVEGLLIAGSVFLAINVGQAAIAGLSLAALIVSLTGMVIAINLLWPRLETEGGRRPASGIAATVSLILEFIVAALVCGLLIGAISVWPHSPDIGAALIAALFLLTAGIFATALSSGSRLLANLLTSDPRPR